MPSSNASWMPWRSSSNGNYVELMKRRLGLNIDHVATLRNAREARYPDPVETLPILKKCRVDQVTLHLREDRRHIRDDDLRRIISARALPVNLEMAVTAEMLKVALKTRPAHCTLVPEKRREITTEGGLDCVKNARVVARATEALQKKGVLVSLFIDADPDQILMANRLGAEAIEIHTGRYCDLLEDYSAKRGTYRWDAKSRDGTRVESALGRVADGAALAKSLGLKVFAGHGLHVQNLAPMTKIGEIEEYNIGHAVIARAVFIGLERAVREIQEILK